ncbi:purine-nucleoside phosphorylase [Sporobolomyces koalae]|uniref:purine-nucleoside phosphorylase n=1 Tax=Sporobolomyces koalae TaxID=500713 RepID=UPI00317CF3A4
MLTRIQQVTALATVLAASAIAAPATTTELERRDAGVITPKVMIVSMFGPEREPWIEPAQLYNNISFLGASPLFPEASCDRGLETCLVVTGEGEINAASTIMALTLSPKFDLRQTYFLIAGIAGISPAVGTLGSAVWARFVVQAGLTYELDSREMPSNWTDPVWAMGTKQPGELPNVSDLYGTEVIELNTNLLDRVFSLTKDLSLNDSSDAIEFRKQYDTAPANQPPSVVLGDAMCSDSYFSGSLTGTWERYLNMMTNGLGKYATTAQEDSATLEALVRADEAQLVDFSRVMLLRTGSDFDRAPANSTTDAYTAFYENQIAGGFDPAIENLQIVGNVVRLDIIANWEATYSQGIAPQTTENGSYYGDDLATLRPNGTAQARYRARRSFSIHDE